MYPDTNPAAPRPGEPTNAPPGSEGKIRILIERAERREPLFHPQDYLLRDDPRQARPEPAVARMESA